MTHLNQIYEALRNVYRKSPIKLHGACLFKELLILRGVGGGGHLYREGPGSLFVFHKTLAGFQYMAFCTALDKLMLYLITRLPLPPYDGTSRLLFYSTQLPRVSFPHLQSPWKITPLESKWRIAVVLAI